MLGDSILPLQYFLSILSVKVTTLLSPVINLFQVYCTQYWENINSCTELTTHDLYYHVKTLHVHSSNLVFVLGWANMIFWLLDKFHENITTLLHVVQCITCQSGLT